MKQKHKDGVPVVMFCLALVVAVAYAAGRPAPSMKNISSNGPSRVPDVYIPEPERVKTASRLTRVMNTLAYPSSPAPGRADLRLFGVPAARKTTEDHAIRKHAAGKASKTADYRLTLVFTSEKRRFCVIDGSLYAVDETLPDGGIVRKIAPARVAMEKPWGRVWVPLAKAAKDDTQDNAPKEDH